MMPDARLVGDGIERPENARALMDAAAMFGVAPWFSPSAALADAWSPDLGGGALPWVQTADLIGTLAPLIVVENTARATSVYEARLPAGTPSIVVGNERRGVRHGLVEAAAALVDIPMTGRGVDTLNVASAAAVALYYLLGSARRSQRSTARPESRRPGLLLCRPSDHVEAGSALRSAAAFGWHTIGLDDRERIWFGVPRGRRAEGRAAARRHRNTIRVVPMEARASVGYARAVIVGACVEGPELHDLELARRDTLVVIPDGRLARDEDWAMIAPVVEHGRVALPVELPQYRYRLIAAIVMAELSRQVGRPSSARTGKWRRLSYRSAIEMAAISDIERVDTDELAAY